METLNAGPANPICFCFLVVAVVLVVFQDYLLLKTEAVWAALLLYSFEKFFKEGKWYLIPISAPAFAICEFPRSAVLFAVWHAAKSKIYDSQHSEKTTQIRKRPGLSGFAPHLCDVFAGDRFR